MSGAALVSNGSHHIAVMRLGQARFSMESLVLRLQSAAGIFGLSPQLGLEPAPHTSEALAERYLNGNQLILGNLSFRPSKSSSLIVLSQIHCPLGSESVQCSAQGDCKAIPALLSNNLAWH
jgi:hypothetical protein